MLWLSSQTRNISFLIFNFNFLLIWLLPVGSMASIVGEMWGRTKWNEMGKLPQVGVALALLSKDSMCLQKSGSCTIDFCEDKMCTFRSNNGYFGWESQFSEENGPTTC
jgi:hypothetical protein